MPTSTSPNLAAVHLSDMDRELVTWLARYRAATVPVLLRTRYAGKARSGIYKRLERLVRVGLLEDPRTGPSNRARPRDVPALYVVTRTGMQWAQCGLPCRPVPVAAVKHTLAVAQTGMWLEVRGHAVITDREMRHEIALWRASGDRITPPSAPWMGSDEVTRRVHPAWYDDPRPVSTHTPDLVLSDESGGLTAMEVELTAKSEGRTLDILTMYGRSRKYSRVDYLVPDERMARGLHRLLDRMPVEDQPNVHVQPLRFEHP